MDEPLSGLETPLRRRILSYLLKVQEEFGIPTLHVSHDATETRVLSDEVAVLEKGRVTARGFPDDVFIQPAVLPLASEESFENLVTGRVLPWGDTDAAAIELEQGLHVLVPAGEISGRREVTVAVSAEDLILAMEPPGSISARNILPGVVTRVHDLRSESQVLVLVDIGKKPTRFVTAVTHHTRRNLGVEPGRRVHLVAKVQSFRIVSSR